MDQHEPMTENTPLGGMILAAGLGKRLQPLTLFRAKAVIPFLNRPLIDYAIELLQRARVAHIVINLHHLPETINHWLNFVTYAESPPPLRFSHEEVILGTAGAIGKARDFLCEDTFVVCNGKIYFEENLEEAIRFHRETASAATLVLVPYPSMATFNPVFMDRDQRISRFGKGGGAEDPSGAYVFTGVHILSREVLTLIPEGPSDTVRDLYPRLIRNGYPVRGFLSRAYWCECSSPRTYLFKSLEVLTRRGLDNLTTSGGLQARCQSVIADPSAEADPSCQLENCVIWDGVKIGARSSLRNVILSSGVELPQETHLQDVVVTPLPEELPGDTRKWVRGEHLIRPL